MQAAEADSHLAALPKPQREGALGQRRTKIPRPSQNYYSATIADAVAAKAIPKQLTPHNGNGLGPAGKELGLSFQ